MTGFGSSWGRISWGGSTLGGLSYHTYVNESLSLSEALGDVVGVNVTETLSILEALAAYVPLRVVSAVPISPYYVDVVFSHDLDPGFLPNLDPTNYLIPSLTVVSTSPGSTQNIVRLHTSEQSSILYNLEVAQGQALTGELLDPLHDEAAFAGYPIAPSFFAVAQSRRKVELVFSAAMLQDVAFTNPASYVIEDFEGSSISVVSAAASGPTPISRVTLVLGADLDSGGYYQATVGPTVKTTVGLSVSPPTVVFQWKEMLTPVYQGPIVISFQNFSGEVTKGLLGQPAGQLFFSPALETAVPNSVIQVDSASVCTRAYDEYHFPELVDPPALFTFQAGHPSSQLNANALWASAERQGLSRVNLTDHQAESVLIFEETFCTALLREPIDIDYGGFLNDDRWGLYDGVVQSFAVYDNIAHGGPGPSDFRVLEGTVSFFDDSFDDTFE